MTAWPFAAKCCATSTHWPASSARTRRRRSLSTIHTQPKPRSPPSPHNPKTPPRPIHRLLREGKRVPREKDYTLRVEKEANDEIGLLIDGFNEMLSEIRSRDAEILARHDQEMALARSIQTSVLPRSFELPGYDISAIMLPAEEVGGDFYEFRRTGAGAWIGVGDVTGHGVTSGLIMMMAQAMFTMLCEQNGHYQSPAKFVSLLN